MRVLVVEDDVRLAEVLSSGLAAEGFAVDVVHDGQDGYWQAHEGAHDVIVLEILLPSIKAAGIAEPRTQHDLAEAGELPPWLGDETFHRSHQSAFVSKDPARYRRWFPSVADDLPYVWPTSDRARPVA